MRTSPIAFVAFALAAFAASAAADGVPEGTHLTHEDAVVHLGPWHDYASWVYAVRRGDTLSEIAERELGTLRRTPEIASLNPGLDPLKIKPGQGVRMPPRRIPAAYDAVPSRNPGAPRPWWDFYVLPVLGDGEQERPALVDSGSRVPWHRGGVTLFAVRHDRARDVLAALAAAPGRSAAVLEQFAADGVAATSREVLGGGRFVDDASAVHYGLTGFEVLGIESGRIELLRHERREYDRHRALIGGPGGGLGRAELLLIAVGCGAIVVFVLLVRRRHVGVELPVSG